MYEVPSGTSDDEDLYDESSGDEPYYESEGSGEGDGEGGVPQPEYEEYEEDEEEVEEDDSSPVTVVTEISEASSKFRQQFFILNEIDILSLDNTCMQDFVEAPTIKNAEISGKSVCLETIYVFRVTVFTTSNIRELSGKVDLLDKLRRAVEWSSMKDLRFFLLHALYLDI